MFAILDRRFEIVRGSVNVHAAVASELTAHRFPQLYPPQSILAGSQVPFLPE